MSQKVFNRNGGNHSEMAFSALENRAYGSSVANVSSFAITKGAGLTLNIASGDGLIDSGANFAYRVQNDSATTLDAIAGDASYARKDYVIMYVDTAMSPTTTPLDNVGHMKFDYVTGTPSASPQAPSDSAIQTKIGAGKPYYPIWGVTMPAGATNLTSATLTDKRKIMTSISSLYGGSTAGLVKTSSAGVISVGKAGLSDILAGSTAGVLQTTSAGVVTSGKVKSENVDLTTLSKICLGGTYNDVPIAQDAQIVFDKTISTSGTGLTKVGNTVRVGAGIKQISVSANVFAHQSNTSQAYAWVALEKNNVTLAQSIADLASGSRFNGIAFTPYLIDVVEGDVISLKAIQGNWSVRGVGTFMTVMQVA